MLLNHETHTMPSVLSDLLLFEISPNYCRDSIDLAAHTAALPLGTVLAHNGTAYIPYMSDTPADGEANAAACAVLICDMPANTAVSSAIVLARGATIAQTGLVFADGVTEAQITSAIDALKALGIIVRS